MARIITLPFELNTTTSGVEYTKFGSPTIAALTDDRFGSGGYAMRVNNPTSGGIWGGSVQFASSNINVVYCRAYVYFATLPTGDTNLFSIFGTAGTGRVDIIYSSASQVFQGHYNNYASSLTGSSVTLQTGRRYRLEILIDKSGSSGAHIVKVRLDDVEFISATTLTLNEGSYIFEWGSNLQGDGTSTMDVYFDDIAVNDNSGSSQNSWPGRGRIIRLDARAAGDANSFGTQTGGTAGSGNNFTRVSEVTPDDATTFNGSNTLNQEDLFQMTASGLSLLDKIKVVEVHGRFRNNTADATTAIKFEIEKASGGTKTQSSAIVPNTTTWNTDSTGAIKTAPIVLYNDPDGTAWSKTTLDTMQAGYKITTGGTNRIDVTKVWVLVEYDPYIVARYQWTNNGADITNIAVPTSLTAGVTIVSLTAAIDSDQVHRGIDSAFTFDSTSMTNSPTSTNNTGQNNQADIYVLKNYTGNGNKTFSMKYHAGPPVYGVLYILQNTDSTTQPTTSGASVNTGASNPSISLTSVNVNDLILELLASNNTATVNASQTVDASGTQNASNVYVSRKAASAGTNAESWTMSSGAFAYAAIAIKVNSTGNAYTSSLSETLSLSDSIAKQAQKSFTATFSLVETFVRTISRSFTTTFSLVETFVKTPARTFVESAISLSDSIVKTTTKAVNETFTLVETFIRSITRSWSESISLSDTVAKTPGRTLVETFSISDSMSIIKSLKRTYTETITLADTLVKSFIRTLSDSLSLSDTFASSKIFLRSLSDSISLSDTITKIRNYARTFTESISLSDTLTRLGRRTFTDSISLTSVFSKVLNKVKSFTESITITDTNTIAGSYAVRFNGNNDGIYGDGVAGAFQPDQAMSIIARVYDLNPDPTTHVFNQDDFEGIVDGVRAWIVRADDNDPANYANYHTWISTGALIQLTESAGAFAPTWASNQWFDMCFTAFLFDGGDGSWHLMQRVWINGSLAGELDTPTGEDILSPLSLARSGIPMRFGAVSGATPDGFFNGYMRDIAVYSYAIDDSAASFFHAGGIPSGPDSYWPAGEGSGGTLTDVTSGYNMTAIDSAGDSGLSFDWFTIVSSRNSFFFKNVTKVLNATFSLTDSLVRTARRTLNDSITLVSTLIKTTTKSFTATISISDNIVKSMTRSIADSIVVVESFNIAKSLHKAFTDTITLSDLLSIAKILQRSFSDSIALVDSISKRIMKVMTMDVFTFTETFLAQLPRKFKHHIVTTVYPIAVKMNRTVKQAITTSLQPVGRAIMKLSKRNTKLNLDETKDSNSINLNQ